jgi:serine protease Do
MRIAHGAVGFLVGPFGWESAPVLSSAGSACQADRSLHLRSVMLLHVKSSLGLSAVVLGILGVMAAAPAAHAQPGVPAPTPGQNPAPAPAIATSPGPSMTPEQLYAHVMHGVVALERNGVPVAVGTVLSGDGRILTALSSLAGGDGADVLYADGTVVHAKVGRSDRAVDLALLVPQTLKWTEGLRASTAAPMGVDLRALLPAPPAVDSAVKARLAPIVAMVKGDADAHARDGVALLHWLDVETKGVAPVAGAPLVDPSGDVAGILVRACKGPVATPAASGDEVGTWTQPVPASAAQRAACKPVVVGAPVSSIRSFLAGAPSAPAAPPPPWLGIRGDRELSGNVHGVRIVAVAPSSPAEKAGLKPSSDLIVAVDGHPVDSPEKLSDVIGKHAAGDTVKLLVLSSDQFHEVAVLLRAAAVTASATSAPPGPAPAPADASGGLPALP